VEKKNIQKFRKAFLAVGVVILALFLTGFTFLFLENLTLESYISKVQANLLPIFLFISFLVLLIYLYKRTC